MHGVIDISRETKVLVTGIPSAIGARVIRGRGLFSRARTVSVRQGAIFAGAYRERQTGGYFRGRVP